MKNTEKKDTTVSDKFPKKQLTKMVLSAVSLMVFSPEIFAASTIINNGENREINTLWDLGGINTLHVGRDSKGELTVSSGGHIITSLLNIGRYTGGDGEVNVKDGGMITINNNNSYAYPLAIGGEGSSGNGSKGVKGVLNITGNGSQVVINSGSAGEMSIGSQGAEGVLNITDGAKLIANIDRLYIGSRGSAETKGTVIVDGAGSELYSSGRVLIGTFNEGHVLVSNGAIFKTDDILTVGYTNDVPLESTLKVIGEGSLVQSKNETNIGVIGKGALIVADQGTLSASTINIAKNNTSVAQLIVGSRKDEVAVAAGNIEADTIKFGAGNGSILFNHTSNDFELSSAISGKGNVETLSGTTILSGTNTYTGKTQIGGSGILQAGATNTFSTNSTYSTESQGILNLNGYDQTIGNLTNEGTVSLGGASQRVGTTLTVAGNYIGDEGTLILNGALNADDDSITDKLVITGNSSGNTNVKVNNIGGYGAQTINGIEIIEVRGLSNGQFKQDGRIVAGAYDYFLVRGDSAEGTSDQNWYLSSKFIPTPPPDPEPNPDPGTNPGTGGDGSGNDGSNISTKDVVRPEAGSYLGLLEYNQSSFNHSFYDRQQRFDNQYQSAWTRMEYTKSNSKAADSQLDNKAEHTLLYFGADIFQQDNFYIGLMGGYTKNDVDTTSNLSRNKSTAKSDGYSVGVYGTWFDQNKDDGGLYVDTYAQYNWFNNKVNGQGLTEISFDTKSYTVSAETGYGFVLGKTGATAWQIEPQIQFIYNNHEKNNFEEANGTRISIKNSDDFISRVGVRFQGKNKTIEPFVTLNYWNHSKNAEVSMNETQIYSERARNIYEVKAGGKFHLNKNLDLFAQASSGWGDNSTRIYGGNIGLKINW